MIFTKKQITFLLLFLFTSVFAQQKQEQNKVSVSGRILDKTSKLPLEFINIILKGANSNQVMAIGTTDVKGNFIINVNTGSYTIKYESMMMTHKTTEVKDSNISENTNLGIIYLDEDVKQLETVEVRAEKTTIELKLDKKVYNVGKDIIVRGGTVSDVLDNVPSVSVDAEGAVSLRGNENVRILIDGKPTNAINVNDALRMISAESIDKVEVVTNPSARYDAEGGGGIINIILKKGKNQGLNGTFILTGGIPENSGTSANINLKSELFNLFTTVGYNKRNSPGRTKIDQESFTSLGQLESVLNERRKNERLSEGLNLNFGIELLLDKNTSWTNALNYRDNDGQNQETVQYYNYNQNRDYINTRQRFNDLSSDSESVEFTTNFIKKFKKEGHKLTVDGSFSANTENEKSNIEGVVINNGAFVSSENTRKKDKQNRNLLQFDYVLPINKVSQLEMGFRGNYVTLLADFQVQERVSLTSPFTNITAFTNTLEYVENVNAIYTQFGSKIKKFSYLLGLRFEDSTIEINQFVGNIFKTKNYNNFFPSAFLTYELTENSSVSANYSKRIQRPRDRFINPFASYTSNINLFQGNPEINPAFSDAYDLGYLRKWDKITLSTSVYYNHTTDAMEVIRRERGDKINGVPVIINTPFNLGTNDRTGFEFTLNYTPKKWWKLNGNFNFFNNVNRGNYTYTNSSNSVITQNFDSESKNWFTRITSKVNLPYKIEWQTNATYNSPQKYGQGTIKGIASANLAFSKDILKDMGTLAVNVNDVFNSRKRIQELQLPNVNSNSEMQWRTRQITFSFTYRFNKKKTDKETKPRTGEGENEMM